MTINENLNEWSEAEWREFTSRLKKLSTKQLRQIANEAGIMFEGGVESLKDKNWITAKEQIILVLDEVSKEKLLEVYERILKKSE